MLVAGAQAVAVTGMPNVPIPPPSGTPLEAQAEQWVHDWARALRDTSNRFDAKQLAAQNVAAAQPGESRQMFFDRLAHSIAAVYYSFAPQHARHDDTVRYRLPFPLDQPRFLTQGVGGRFSHQGDQRNSFDFAMPVGSQVLAARAGTVVRVRDGSTRGGLDRANGGAENDVLVLHSDGTFAAYVHLRAGIAVHEGQQVAQGDPIGFSGNTGYTGAPHLHFGVLRMTGPTTFESVPIRFGVGSPQGFVPVEGQFYGGQPNRTVALVASANGAPLSEGVPLRLSPGARAQLVVTMTAPGGAPVDVTRAPGVRFFAPTAWSVTVDEKGLVVGSPTADYAAALAKLDPSLTPPGSADWGVVVVSYEAHEHGHSGFTSFPVLIRDDAKP
jgi:murein DD-endopeptidase MepM/ murein hydrolase activator NlpD